MAETNVETKRERGTSGSTLLPTSFSSPPPPPPPPPRITLWSADCLRRKSERTIEYIHPSRRQAPLRAAKSDGPRKTPFFEASIINVPKASTSLSTRCTSAFTRRTRSTKRGQSRATTPTRNDMSSLDIFSMQRQSCWCKPGHFLFIGLRRRTRTHRVAS